MVFKTKVLHFKIENTPIKDTNGKRKFKRMLSFLFVDKRKLFAMKLSFEEFNLVFYTADRSVWLVSFEQPKKVKSPRIAAHYCFQMKSCPLKFSYVKIQSNKHKPQIILFSPVLSSEAGSVFWVSLTVGIPI